MPKTLLREPRSNFSGGLNTAVSPDSLEANELVQATNVRLVTEFGAIAKRTGSQRLHDTTIGAGAAVRGLFQWDAPAGKQTVAVANGNFYHKLTAATDFTEVVPASAMSTVGPTYFAVFRDTSASAAIILYMASANGLVYSWDGTTLTRRDGTDSVPNSPILAAYHTRVFYGDLELPKHAFWTKVGTAIDAGTGGATDGGSAIVDLLTGEGIIQLKVIGSSLAIATEDSVVRFSGYSNEDIRIEQDTEGMSPEHGPVGPGAFIVAENLGWFLSDRGPYAGSETGVQAVGTKVEPEFDALDRSVLANVVMGYNRGRREMLVAGAGAGDSTANKTVYVNSLRLGNAWIGPWTYPFGIVSLARYENATGSESLIAGGDDGFVRHMDTGVRDDVLRNGTSGSTYTMTAELAPEFFSVGPDMEKSLLRVVLQADLPATTSLDVKAGFDLGALTTKAVTGIGAGKRPYRVDIDGQGGRLRVVLEDDSADIPIIQGITMLAYDMKRPVSA